MMMMDESIASSSSTSRLDDLDLDNASATSSVDSDWDESILFASLNLPSRLNNNSSGNNNNNTNTMEAERIIEDGPLLVSSMSDHFNYTSLSSLLQLLEFGNPHNILPGELAERCLQYLLVEPVQPDRVRVTGASSSEGSFPLESCLDPSEQNWWLSAAMTMPSGKGCEYLQFALSPCCHVRLTAVSIKIPPLPQGPLSVRRFYLQGLQCLCRNQTCERILLSSSRGGGGSGSGGTALCTTISTTNPACWKRISSTYHVANRSGWQRFPLTELTDIQHVRLVCQTNQIHDFQVSAQIQQQQQHRHHRQPQNTTVPFASVGLYAVKFD